MDTFALMQKEAPKLDLSIDKKLYDKLESGSEFLWEVRDYSTRFLSMSRVKDYDIFLTVISEDNGKWYHVVKDWVVQSITAQAAFNIVQKNIDKSKNQCYNK